ncbi:MAG: hypothetical protein IKJ19_08050 [Clostridia bacterium]|nr:hypothetical protein [Clostridia bacterium]
MNKTVIVINGQGGSGKDSICHVMSKYYKVKNISTVDPIKAIAKFAGWNGEKGDKARKMLADLKQVFIEYCDLPLNFVLQEAEKFKLDENDVMFVHCRESEEIQKIIDSCPLKTITLLVRRNDRFYEHKVFGNSADDDVENFNYDFIYNGNNETMQDLERTFMEFFEQTIKPTL